MILVQKNYLFIGIIAFVCFCLIPFFAYAERTYKFTGTDVYGQHIRALSMGNAFTAVAKTGETALMYNPAGLASTFKGDDWYAAFALNLDASVSEAALDFAEDSESISEESDPGQVSELVKKYEDEVIFVGARASFYGFYQKEQPFNPIDRGGVAYQRLANVGLDVRFNKLADTTVVSFTDDSGETKPAEEIAEDVTTVVEDELDVELTPEQQEELEAAIEEEIENISDEDLEELEEKAEQLNEAVSYEIQIAALLWNIQNAGIAGSILDDQLKLGVSVNSIDLISRRLNLKLATAVSGDIGDLDTLAPEQKGNAIGFDVGMLYRFDVDWRPQIGFAWQNVGGTDLGEETDTEIVETFNLGASLTKELGGNLLFVVAADVTDISGNYKLETEQRSFLQRSHLGVELGFGEAASMEHRYISLRGGVNRGQPTFGVEVSLPYNIIRIGYASIGTDVGDESESIPVVKRIYYLSFGVAI